MDLATGMALLGIGNMQHRRLLRLDFPHGDGPAGVELLANRLDADEALSRDFQFDVEVIATDAHVNLDDVVGRMVTVSLVRDDGTLRYFNGYVFEFGFLRTDGGFAFYRMVLRPWLAFLHLRHNCAVFQGVTVLDICEQTFQHYPQRDVESRVFAQLPPLTLAIQYNESDHNHVHRRLEAAGLFYWYEHRFDGHRLCIGDDSTACAAVDGDAAFAYRADAGALESDGITLWQPQRQLVPNKAAVASFDFKRARSSVGEGTAVDGAYAAQPLELYENGGAYAFPSIQSGDALAQRRIAEEAARASVITAQGNHRAAQPGRSFSLDGHFLAARDYTIVAVRHEATNNYQDGRAAQSRYQNNLRCLPKNLAWLPGRGYASQDVRIHSVQTAIVTGPEGDDIHTDEYGRVRVTFHWDRDGKRDASSSPWVRVMTGWAGARFGLIALPRVGQEVVVQFIEGNADRPLVVGSVYNTDNMPPWELPANKTQSGVLTRSAQGGSEKNANALRFEDKQGSEEVWLHAERNQRIEVERDESHTVGNDRSKTIERDEHVHVKRNRAETVGQNEHIAIGGARSEMVGHDDTVIVKGARHERVLKLKEESVGLAKTLSVGGAYAISVGGEMNTVVADRQFTEVRADKQVQVRGRYAIDAGEQFELTVGSGSLAIGSDGSITLRGTSILIEASGPVRVNGKDVDLN